MDVLATGLAGIIVLTVPLLLWLRIKARAQYARELAEIQALASERSHLLTELHSRLDALEHRESQLKPMGSTEGVNHFRYSMLMVLSSAKNRETVLERYYLALKDGDTASLEKYHHLILNPKRSATSEAVYEICHRWLKYAQPRPDWQNIAIPDSTVTGAPHWKEEWQYGSWESAHRPTLQVS